MSCNTAADANEIALRISSTIDVNYCDVEGEQAGIYNDGSGTTLDANGVTVLAENGSTSNKALDVSAGTVRLGVSQLDGSASWMAGTLTCFQMYTGSYTAFPCP